MYRTIIFQKLLAKQPNRRILEYKITQALLSAVVDQFHKINTIVRGEWTLKKHIVNQ